MSIMCESCNMVVVVEGEVEVHVPMFRRVEWYRAEHPHGAGLMV